MSYAYPFFLYGLIDANILHKDGSVKLYFMFKTYVLKNEQKIRYFYETAIILRTGVIESINRFTYHIK